MWRWITAFFFLRLKKHYFRNIQDLEINQVLCFALEKEFLGFSFEHGSQLKKRNKISSINQLLLGQSQPSWSFTWYIYKQIHLGGKMLTMRWWKGKMGAREVLETQTDLALSLHATFPIVCLEKTSFFKKTSFQESVNSKTKTLKVQGHFQPLVEKESQKHWTLIFNVNFKSLLSAS